MSQTISGVSISPFTNTDEEGQINTYAEGYTDEEIDGWRVQSLAAGGRMIDDNLIDVFDTAWEHAKALVQEYGVEID